MNKICRICKLEFRPDIDKTEVVVCKDCTDAIKQVLLTESERNSILDIISGDETIKSKFLDKILNEQDALEKICMKMFSLPVKTIGLGGAGTIADFFRENSDT